MPEEFYIYLDENHKFNGPIQEEFFIPNNDDYIVYRKIPGLRSIEWEIYDFLNSTWVKIKISSEIYTVTLQGFPIKISSKGEVIEL